MRNNTQNNIKKTQNTQNRKHAYKNKKTNVKKNIKNHKSSN